MNNIRKNVFHQLGLQQYYLCYQLYDMLNVICYAWLASRRQALELSHIKKKLIDKPTTQTCNCFTTFICTLDNLVVNVCEITNILNFIPQKFKVPVEDIEGDVGTRVADVAEVVGRDAADVHGDLPLHQRLEGLLRLRHGVEQLQLRRRLGLRRGGRRRLLCLLRYGGGRRRLRLLRHGCGDGGERAARARLEAPAAAGGAGAEGSRGESAAAACWIAMRPSSSRGTRGVGWRWA